MERMRNKDLENAWAVQGIRQEKCAKLEEENKKLKKYYDRDKEELMESCYSLAKENEKLKSDLSECECSMHFENDEVGYRKRECKKLNIKVASLEGEIKGLNYTIEKLKEENQTLELWLDNKEKLNEEYRKQIDDKRMELSTIAEETIADLQSRIKELEENEKYRHSRCMKAERQYEHSLGDDELIYEEGLYD